METMVTKQGFIFRGTLRELNDYLASWRGSQVTLNDLIRLNLH